MHGAVACMVTLSQNLTLGTDNDSAHQGIGRNLATALFCQRDGLAHMPLMNAQLGLPLENVLHKEFNHL